MSRISKKLIPATNFETANFAPKFAEQKTQGVASSNGNISGENNNNNEGRNTFIPRKAEGPPSPFGKPITAFHPIAGCPQGLEGLYGGKNFFFQEVQRGHIEYDLKDETRPTYNIITNDGKRLYVMINQSTRFAPKKCFHYDLVGPNGMTCMTFDGDIGSAPVFPCSKNSRFKGIQAIQFHQVVGEIVPEYTGSQCNTYLNCGSNEVKYNVKCTLGTEVFDAVANRPKRRAQFDSGLNVISTNEMNTTIARVSNCRKENFEFAKGPVNFALSLTDDYTSLDPVAKSMLLACALLHEIYYMRTPGRPVDHTRFKNA